MEPMAGIRNNKQTPRRGPAPRKPGLAAGGRAAAHTRGRAAQAAGAGWHSTRLTQRLDGVALRGGEGEPQLLAPGPGYVGLLRGLAQHAALEPLRELLLQPRAEPEKPRGRSP